MPEDSCTLLFIYGTLRKGCRAHARMRNSEFVGMATMQGELVYAKRYPGFVTGRGTVHGELYKVDAATLRSLDEYEGCFIQPPHYLRENRKCTSSDLSQIDADVYVFQHQGSGEFEIPDGDWLTLIQQYPELNSFEE